MRIDLGAQRSTVVAELRRAMRLGVDDRQRLLGVRGDALRVATRANLTLLDAPTTAAIERYTGVLYKALDVQTLDHGARRTLDRSLLIFSGLWGLVAPGDPIPDYKLKMGARLDRLGRLSLWWREAVSREIQDLTRGRPIWNLLPKEHDAALGADLPVEQYSVRFLEPNRTGDLVAVSHWNKSLKGALVRYLVENPSTEAADLAEWTHPSGFRIDPALTETVGIRTLLTFVKR